MHILRWILTAPAAILGWYLGLVAAMIGHRFSEGLCPHEHIVSGMCFASWVPIADAVLLAVGATVAGVMTVLLPTLVAPAYKGRVALSAYLSGAIGSIYWMKHGIWMPAVCADVSGLLCLWLVYRKLTAGLDKTKIEGNPFLVLWYRIPINSSHGK